MHIYIINPIFFIVVAVLTGVIIVKPISLNKYKKTIIQYALITGFIYILIYLISGVFLTYGKNPYSLTAKGILLNLYSMGTVIFAREFIRYRLINNVSKKDRKMFFILIVIVFVIYDIPAKSLFENFNIYYVFKMIFAIILPSITKNCLYTYTQMYTNYIPTLIYEAIINLVQIVSPVLPNTPWIFNAILDTALPLILLIYCMYEITQKDKEYRNRRIRSIKPKGIIIWTVAVIMIIWFALGIFPIKPVGIATGSMTPNLNIGDLVIILKCNENDIKENDIIEYQKDKYTVIHRVIKKYMKNGETFFVTKGDNNEDEDMLHVTRNQLKGKVIFRIAYLAMPTIWIRNLTMDKSNVDIELGR